MRTAALLSGLAVVMLAPPPTIRAAEPFSLRVPVLMYHHIYDWPGGDVPNSSLYVSPARFDEQMALLKRRGWHTITGPRLAAALRDHECLPSKTFVVTFDDGWQDAYRWAAPVLDQRGFVGSFYATVGKMLDDGDDPNEYKQHFTVDEARDLVARGHFVGNHTMNHRSVTRLGQAGFQKEISDAQAVLAFEGLGQQPKTFVYPFGSYNDAAVEYLANDGYAMAFTTEAGGTHSEADPLRSPRMRVSRSTSAKSLLDRMRPFNQPCE